MKRFELPTEISFNTEQIADPSAFAKARGAASWLYLNGEEFSAMEGGMSFAQVQGAVGASANVISDPPRTLDLDLARRRGAEPIPRR